MKNISVMERDCIVVLLFDLLSVLGNLLHHSAGGRLFEKGQWEFFLPFGSPKLVFFGIVSLIDSTVGSFRVSDRKALLFLVYLLFYLTLFCV